MGRLRNKIVMLSPSLGMGVIVPVAVIYGMVEGLSAVVGLIAIFFSLVAAAIVGVVALTTSLGVFLDDDAWGSAEEREKLRLYRSSTENLAKQMDELNSTLGQIRDALRPEGANQK